MEIIIEITSFTMHVVSGLRIRTKGKLLKNREIAIMMERFRIKYLEQR